MKINTGHYFGTSSRKNLQNVHKDLKKIHEVGIRRCPVDYGINQGFRTKEKQLQYFLEGKSQLDPRKGQVSKHMINPAEATDIHIAEKHQSNTLTWDKMHLTFVAAYLISVSHELYEAGEISHVLRWGGNWDNDGVIGLDQTLQDFPHLELMKP